MGTALNTEMLQFEDALERILALSGNTLDAELVAIEEADNRVLAAHVIAATDSPQISYSAVDGYAVSSRDLATSGPFRLKVHGESRAGSAPTELLPQTAHRIFTGAPIPLGADAVIMQENVRCEGHVAHFARAASPYENVRRRGADLSEGAVALSRGTRLRPAHLSLCASLNLAHVSVVRRARVTVVATGDELRKPGESWSAGTIPESITVALASIARRVGAEVRVLPFVGDNPAALERTLLGALDRSDVVITIGGVSVGDHDLVRPALQSIGVALDFWRVAIKPGKPLAVGRYRRTAQRDAVVVGLPGNPASALVTFQVFVVPLLRAMSGDAQPLPERRRVKLEHAYPHSPGRLELARAITATNADGSTRASLLSNQASGAATTMAEANALVLIPAASTGVEAGEGLDALLLSELGG